MSPIRYLSLPLLGILSLTAENAAQAADQSLGQAVKTLDAKYLEVPEIGIVDKTAKIVAGGGEDGLPPLEDEVSLGPLRVTLTYVEEEPGPEDEVPPDELPEEALPDAPPEAADAITGSGTGPMEEAIPLEDIPEEAMLPDEMGLGDAAPNAPVVTVYFDDPNAGAAASPVGAGDVESPGVDDQGQPAQSGEPAAASEGNAGEPPPGPRVVATLEGDSAGFSNPPVSIQIAELDPANPYPEVVVSFFTGGAHCCSVTSVVTSNADGSAWQVVDVGEFDGGPMSAVDLDGDGVHEFETRDNAFLYAFACYACSEAPLQVLALKDGTIEDVSGDPRYQPAHAAWLKNMIVGVPEQEVNGFLAGYVGQKIRLGEGKEAWDLMLDYYDRNTDWGLEVCEPGLDENGECPAETKMVSFPEALEHMLNENGYKIGG